LSIKFLANKIKPEDHYFVMAAHLININNVPMAIYGKIQK